MEHKCIIAGVGRSGTTFLVELLTELGLDTGFADEARYRSHYSDDAKAGLEINPLREEHSPYIVKDPRISDYLDELVESKRFVIDQVFVPIRQLDDAAMSRVHVSNRRSVMGGMWKTRHAYLQKPILAETLYGFVHRLSYHEIPCTFLEFPRFVHDAGYAYRRLHFLTRDIEWGRFLEAHSKRSRPEHVHAFSSTEKERALMRPHVARRLINRFRDWVQ